MEYDKDYTEAEALADIEEGRSDYDDVIDGGTYLDWRKSRNDSIRDDYAHYLRNKEAKVGATITCAENRCAKRFKKKSYQQAFCCTKHKNQFWNRQRLL
jgi:hypothetical protein